MAEARRGAVVYSTPENLEYVATTKLPAEDGNPVALCHLVEERTLLFVLPIGLQIMGYVLAPGRCEGESYLPVDADKFVIWKRMGMFPADLPAEPRAAPGWRIADKALTGIGFVLLALFALVLLGKPFRGGAPSGRFTPKMIDAMCLMARTDGRVAQEEVAAIQAIAGKIAGKTPAVEVVFGRLEAAPTRCGETELQALVRGLNRKQKQMMYRAVALVAFSDGRLKAPERSLLSRFGIALGVEPQAKRNIYDEMKGPHMAPA